MQRDKLLHVHRSHRQWGQCALSASDGGDDWTSVLNKIQVAKNSATTCDHPDQTSCDDDAYCFWSGETSSCWHTRTAADAYIEQYFTSTPIDSIKAYNAHGDHPNNFHNLHNLFCGTMSLDDAACDGTPGCQYQLSTNDWEANCTAVREYGLEELSRACGPALDSFSEASASSVLGAEYDVSKAVDGDAGTWFHSDTGEDHAWFALDLGFSREVHNFSFIGHGTNEGCNCQMLLETQSCAFDCSTGTYGGFYVVVSDELPTSSASGSGWDLFDEATSSGTLCEHVTSWDRTPDGSGVPVTYACPTSTTGRYVYVQTSAKVVIVGETHVGLGSDGADAVARAAGYVSFGQLEASASEGLWNPPGADICEAWRNDAMCEIPDRSDRLRELGVDARVPVLRRRVRGDRVLLPAAGTSTVRAADLPTACFFTSWGRLLTTTPISTNATGINRATVAVARWTRRHATTTRTATIATRLQSADRASQEDERIWNRRAPPRFCSSITLVTTTTYERLLAGFFGPDGVQSIGVLLFSDGMARVLPRIISTYGVGGTWRTRADTPPTTRWPPPSRMEATAPSPI